MKANDTERRAASASRWREWLEYLNAVCAISSWGLYGPRAWLIDDHANELLSRVMRRAQSQPGPRDGTAEAPAAPSPALAGCCCCGGAPG